MDIAFSPPIGYLVPGISSAAKSGFRQLRSATVGPGYVLGFDAQMNLAAMPNSAIVEFESFEIAASEDIPAFAPVNIRGEVADSTQNADFGKVVGVAAAAIATGFVGSVITFGTLTNSAWSWTAGSTIFLNGTTLSQTPVAVGFSQAIGVAKSSDTIFVSLSDPILL
jgi:hypothetical protein